VWQAVVKDSDVSENGVRGIGVQSGGEAHLQVIPTYPIKTRQRYMSSSSFYVLSKT